MFDGRAARRKDEGAVLGDGMNRKVTRTALRKDDARHDKHVAIELVRTCAGTSALRTLSEGTFAAAINSAVEVPPGFGQGKAWGIRIVKWTFKDSANSEPRERTALIPNGTRVNEQLHSFYWKERETYSAMIAALAAIQARPAQFFLVRRNGTVAGGGFLNSGDGPDDIAWLSCMFAEMLNCNLAFPIPERIHSEDIMNIKGAEVCEVVPAAKQ